MNDNIFAFRGFNHSRKSSTIYWLIIIHARRTFVQSTSIPIKMSKRNFMSLVPNVASIEIILLWPHENINWQWIDFYDVNCEWHLYPIDFTNFMEVENILWVLESPRLNKNVGVLMQMPTLFRMHLVQIGNVSCLMKSTPIMASSTFLFATKSFYACHIFVCLCSPNLTKSRCDPLGLVTFVGCKETCKQ
jgi:hypothetical protein